MEPPELRSIWRRAETLRWDPSLRSGSQYRCLRLLLKGFFQVGADAIEDGFGKVFTNVAVEDGAVAADQDVSRKALHTEVFSNRTVRVKVLQPGHLMAGDESLPSALVVVFADADHDELIAAIYRLQLLELGKRASTRPAPGSPKIEKNYAATKIGERKSLAVRAGGEVRSFLTSFGVSARKIVVVEQFGRFGGGRLIGAGKASGVGKGDWLVGLRCGGRLRTLRLLRRLRGRRILGECRRERDQ